MIEQVCPSHQEPPKATETLYSEKVLFFDDTRKWKERFVVVRGDYSLECHDSYEVSAILPGPSSILASRLSSSMTML